MSSYGMLKEGYLTKIGEKHPTWHKRCKVLGVEKAPPDVKKKFCFAVKTPDRTYLIHAEEEEDMKNWMRSIESISELHKTKDKYDGREKYSAIDGYRNEIILYTKKIVQNVVKATGLTKSIAERFKKQEANTISAENNVFGELAIRVAGDALLTITNVFDTKPKEEFRKSLSQLKDSRAKITAIGKGTSNEAALETVLKALGEDIDKLLALEIPRPSKEIATSIECLLSEISRFLDSNTNDERVELGKRVAKAGQEFIATCNTISQLIPDAELRAKLVNTGTEIPVLADQIREGGKNAKVFAGDDEFQKELQGLIKDLDKVVEEVAEIVQKAFGERPRFSKLQISNVKL
jgi:hypothetical protein